MRRGVSYEAPLLLSAPKTTMHETTIARTHYDIASRASNYDEQTAISEALAGVHPNLPPHALTPLDAWKLERLAPRLAAARQAPVEQVQRVLVVNRSLQYRSGDLTTYERRVLEDVHRAWLPAYRAALEAFDPAMPDPWIDGPDDDPPALQMLARACAPFRAHLRGNLEDAIDAANALAGRSLFDESFVLAHERHLVRRLELALAWALEADRKVAEAASGRGPLGSPEERRSSYLARTFRDADTYHELYLRFPVLGRWLATAARQLTEAGAELVDRLRRDVGKIGEHVTGTPVRAFTGVALGKSDPHAGGRGVAFVDADAGARSVTFVYKPRDLRGELGLQGLLEAMGRDGAASFGSRRVVAEDGYGYEAFVPTDRNDVTTRGQAEAVYEELGGHVALFYAFGGGDLHYENVIVCDGHAYVCDCETLLDAAPRGWEHSPGTVLDSVFRTGFLEWPRPPGDATVLSSGIAGGQTHEAPIAMPRMQDAPDPEVRHESGGRIEQDLPNRVRLHGELVDPADFADAIVRGFTRAYEWFQRDPLRRSELVADLLGDSRVRFVGRATQRYHHLLVSAQHPGCLVEPLEVDLVFDRLRDVALPWDTSGRAVASETASLWRLDFPHFSAPASGTRLLDDRREVIAELERSPLEIAAGRLRRLSAGDRERQVRYISASLAVEDVDTDEFRTTAVEHSRLIGDELARLFDDGAAPPVPGSLYNGSAGIAFFLLYLDAIDPGAGLRGAAERAVAHALSAAVHGIGTFHGTAGLVYLLIHLHRLWGGDEWLELAVELARGIDDGVHDDCSFDVLDGAAGVIPVLAALSDLTGECLETAHHCARHVLDHAERTEHGLSWAPERPDLAVANLTGFSHGAAGIGWALIGLGARTGRDDYVEAGKLAFAYEATHFDEERQDWRDLRASVLALSKGRPHFGNAWCNGAPGIGLSRIGSRALLGRDDDELLRDAYVALGATLRGFTKVGNDTLCHGTSGNAELLLRFALVENQPAFRLEANLHAQAHWARLAATPAWPAVGMEHRRWPGLMAGIAGVGLHFLRLAYPEQVPSPLLLDPPAPQVSA